MVDDVDGIESALLGLPGEGVSDIGLHRMRQSVHASRGDHLRRKGLKECFIENRVIRDELRVIDRVFRPCFRVDDDGSDSRFASGSRSRWDGN